MVRLPIRHPIRRKTIFESTVPARISERPPAPDEEAVLGEEISKVPPGPERRRVSGTPLAPDEDLLDCGTEHNQDELRENQGKERADDHVSAQPQQKGV